MLKSQTKPPFVLMADDDLEDIMLIRDAFRDSGLRLLLESVRDGQELLDYLRSGSDTAPRPDLILLDLNMPGKDGRQVLGEIKSDPVLRRIPTIVLTTSSREEDVRQCYSLGANSYVCKPPTFDALVAFTEALQQYWFEIVRLPSQSA